ncbi:hypothetical protein QYE47_23260 [Pseudomonas sp. 2,4-D]|uniref:hypothetical protein n=1 Tax=Pseudomonas sp. 2,4-D TaxID=3058433 RepID=UPI002603277D|nr:hypothetical protein [Pseudomonas sp. 2,4-D]MDN4515444.1 hypothetical protein [Pseudomonas sp. 2,4-D]
MSDTLPKTVNEWADEHLAIRSLNLPDHLSDFFEMQVRVIRNTEGALRDTNENRAHGAADALRYAKVINWAEAEHLQRIIANTAQRVRTVQQGEPVLVLPNVAVEGDELVIRITTDTLLHAVSMSDQWPVDGQGQSLAIVTNRALFVQEIADQLQRENEQGATPVHLLFDDAAEEALNAGSEAVVFREEDEGDE